MRHRRPRRRRHRRRGWPALTLGPVRHGACSAQSLQQRVAEHRRAVRRAGAVVVDRGALAGSTTAAASDRLLGPRPALERGLGGERADRGRGDAAEPDPGRRHDAVVDVEREADRDAGDVVEPALGDLVEGGDPGAAAAGCGPRGSARRAAGRVCAVAGEVVGERRPRARPSARRQHDGRVERQQRGREVADRGGRCRGCRRWWRRCGSAGRRTAGTAGPAAAPGRPSRRSTSREGEGGADLDVVVADRRARAAPAAGRRRRRAAAGRRGG